MSSVSAYTKDNDDGDELTVIFIVEGINVPIYGRWEIIQVSRRQLTSDKESNIIIPRLLSQVDKLPSQFHYSEKVVSGISRVVRLLPNGIPRIFVTLELVDETRCDVVGACLCNAGTGITRPLEASDKDKCCSICLEELLVGSQASFLPCNHIFHEHCIRKWIEKAPSCPLCRASSQNYNFFS